MSAAAPGPVGRAAVAAVRLYQRWVSPFLPPSCRFHPSCSEYAARVFQALPPWRALWLTLARLAKCHPLHPGGFDPPPLPGPGPGATADGPGPRPPP